jgi:hypothetical protein
VVQLRHPFIQRKPYSQRVFQTELRARFNTGCTLQAIEGSVNNLLMGRQGRNEELFPIAIAAV